MGSASSTPSIYLHRFWALALPACLAGLLQPLASFTDIAVLGRQASVSSVAAVGLAANYFDIAYLSFGFLRMGTTAWLSHWLAEGNRGAFRQQLVFALSFAGLASLILLVAFLVGQAFIQVPAELISEFWLYTNLRILGAPFAMLNLVVVGFLIATERGKLALGHAFIVHGANIGLNILAVEVLGYGADGVAFATALSQALGVSVGAYLFRDELALGDFLSAYHGDWRSRFLRSLQLNGLLVVRTWLMQSVFLWAQYSALSQGAVEGAALTIWLRWLAFGSYLLDGLAHGVEGVAAQAHKALSLVDFRAWVVRVLVISGSVGALLGCGVIVGGESLHQVVTDNGAVISAALNVARFLPLVLFFGGIAYVLDGLSVAFAAGDALIAMVFFGCIGSLGVATALSAPGLTLAVMGLGAFMVGRVLVGSTWVVKLLWQRSKL